jgi:hypothetical protein
MAATRVEPRRRIEARRRVEVFRFVLIEEHGGELDPAAFVAIVSIGVGETFSLGSGETYASLSSALRRRTRLPPASTASSSLCSPRTSLAPNRVS